MNDLTLLVFEYNVPVSEYLFCVRKYGSKRTLVTKTSPLKSSVSPSETYIETLRKHIKLYGDTSGSWLSRNSVACELFIKKKKKRNVY